MTGPIKPPAPPTGRLPTDPVDATRSPTGADFRTDALTVPETPRNREASPLAGMEGALASLAAELRAGTITGEAAVDRLVASMVNSKMAALLPPEERARLESTFRTQLADDPSLAAMVADLARASARER